MISPTRELPNARKDQWSFDLQRELGRGHGARPAVSSARTPAPRSQLLQQHADARAPATVDPRRPSQNFRSRRIIQNDLIADYDAVSVILRKRMSHGLQVDAHYTWSRTRDMATHSNGGGQTMDNYDIWRDYGPANWDIPHRFVASYIYDMPFLKDSSNAFLKYVVAGWQVSGVTTVQSGTPVNVTISADRANIGISGLQRPDLVGAIPRLNCAAGSGAPAAADQLLRRGAFALPGAVHLRQRVAQHPARTEVREDRSVADEERARSAARRDVPDPRRRCSTSSTTSTAATRTRVRLGELRPHQLRRHDAAGAARREGVARERATAACRRFRWRGGTTRRRHDDTTKRPGLRSNDWVRLAAPRFARCRSASGADRHSGSRYVSCAACDPRRSRCCQRRRMAGVAASRETVDSVLTFTTNEPENDVRDSSWARCRVHTRGRFGQKCLSSCRRVVHTVVSSCPRASGTVGSRSELLMSTTVTRRRLLTLAGLIGAGAAFPAAAAQARRAPVPPPAAANVYESIGVKPLINGRGTFTIIGGSMELPEVRAAKSAANQQYAQLDELMEAAGKRLGELTGAEWGMVSAGCAAAMSHATAACVAGGNPDLHVRMPNLAGFPETRSSFPRIRATSTTPPSARVGVKIDRGRLAGGAAAGDRPEDRDDLPLRRAATDSGPMSTEAICAIAKPHNVPVFVDAAAEILTDPQRAPPARRDAGRLQRRQVHPRSAERWAAARPEGPGPRRLGAQRAASRLRPRHEGRPRGDRRHAGGRRELGQTRPRRGVDAVGRACRVHRQPADEGQGRAGRRTARAG